MNPNADATSDRATMIAIFRTDANEILRAWLHRDEVYVSRTDPVWGQGPLPMNVRWECSLPHWNRYFATVHSPQGWTDLRTIHPGGC